MKKLTAFRNCKKRINTPGIVLDRLSSTEMGSIEGSLLIPTYSISLVEW